MPFIIYLLSDVVTSYVAFSVSIHLRGRQRACFRVDDICNVGVAGPPTELPLGGVSSAMTVDANCSAT